MMIAQFCDGRAKIFLPGEPNRKNIFTEARSNNISGRGSARALRTSLRIDMRLSPDNTGDFSCRYIFYHRYFFARRLRKKCLDERKKRRMPG
jgi:hypothetical protein